MAPTDTAPVPQGPAPQGPAPSPPPPTRRLTRSRDDRLVGGVAAGLADYLGLDPVLVRIGFVLFGIFGGGGVLLYIVLWIVLPEEHTGDVLLRREAGWAEDSRRLRSERGWPFWVGVALIAFAGMALLDQIAYVDTGLVWALVLMGLGVALFRSSSDADSRPPAPASMPQEGATAPIADATRSDAPPSDAVSLTPPPPHTPTPGMAPLHTPPPARRPRERSVLGRLTVGLAILWVGVASLLDEAVTSVDFTAAGIVGVGMAIVGGGLLVGAFAGRARWLILIGILLTPMLLAASFVDRVEVPFGAGVGDRYLGLTDQQPTLVAEMFAGELTIDVAEDGLDGVDRAVTARVGAGRIEVRVPWHWTMVVVGEVEAGEITVHGFDGSSESVTTGFGADIDRTFAGRPGAPTVHLDLDVAVGQVDIFRHWTDASERFTEEVDA